jgi:Fic family protein
MEPVLPTTDGAELAELSAKLLRESAQLGAVLHPITRASVSKLLRPMNSYYSNLIEGHNTHPLDIERALSNDFSSDSSKRALQVESKAHVEVQLLIEQRLASDPQTNICSKEFLCWVHKEFYERLPDEFRWVETASGGKDRVEPGELRVCEVEVGRHIPPTFKTLTQFLSRFSQVYNLASLDPIKRIIAAAASHHRLAWLHPFLDGNGRVTRLFTHAYFIQAKTEGHGLWMVSLGLARHRDDYMAALASGDLPRAGDLDGRGNLSDKGLSHFCKFFLSTAIDQVAFMTELLELDAMQARILFFAERWISQHRVSKESSHLLRDVFLRGEVTRGEAARIMHMPERTARRTVQALLKGRLLETDGPSAPIRLGFPISAVGYYLPRLYPEGVELSVR